MCTRTSTYWPTTCMVSTATPAQKTLPAILCQITPRTATEETTSLQTSCQAPATTTNMTLQKLPHPVLCGESDPLNLLSHKLPTALASNCAALYLSSIASGQHAAVTNGSALALKQLAPERIACLPSLCVRSTHNQLKHLSHSILACADNKTLHLNMVLHTFQALRLNR